MSLYIREDPRFLAECLTSILKQSLQPDEVVIVLDGPITDQLEATLDKFRQKTTLLRIERQPINRGLGHSLAVGVNACRNELIARMDTDDVMRSDRLELQLAEFERDPNLQICSSNILEFDGQPDNVIGHRRVPESDVEIRRFSKKRNPFNHMTVMFKKSAVLKAGNYQPLTGFEDYYLWARMLKQGDRARNIQQDLVFARTGKEMFSRRGGVSYLIPGIKGRYKVYRAGLGGLVDFIIVSAVHIVFSLIPNSWRQKLYVSRLHAS
ncbi:glycosyltransferase [Lacticaseibacillus absianus]|uniref:glycosyltransferase n=1 Tax=Lacticaseibacillus absianus TaxID=2729623 RepID=UPI0015CBC1FE|nr:glycosyltransferase [Lacticaseibacillus absianus]